MPAPPPASRRLPVTPLPAVVVRCPSCAARNRAYAAFCLDCGDPLGDLLAPERPTAGESSRARWSRIAGALLALGILAALLGGWYGDETRAASYRAAVGAQARYDWTTAAQQFQAAIPYADSARRAAHAEATAIERRRLAHDAEYESLAQDWKGLLAGTTRLLAIDPGDAGARRTHDYAQNRLLDAGLPGTLYLVAAGPRAGLYANLAGGRGLLLPGSDGFSRPLAMSPAGDQVVYDRPRRVAGRAPAPQALAGRESVLATFRPPALRAAGAQATLLTTRVLPAAITPGVDGIFVPGGLYWPIYPRDEGEADRLLTFYRFSDQALLPVLAPGTRRYVAALDPAGGLVLFVDPPALDALSPRSHLVAGRPGEAPLFEEWEPGWLEKAGFSVDGQYLLFTMQDGSVTTSLARSLRVTKLPATGAARPTTAQSDLLLSVTSAGPDATDIGADFLPRSGAAPAQALVTVREGPRLTFALRTLSDGMERALWAGAATGPILAQALSANGAWWAYVGSGPGRPRLVLQELAAGTPPLTLATPGLGDGAALYFAPGGTHLVYRSSGDSAGAPAALHSLDLAQRDPGPGSTPPLHPVAIGPLAADDGLPAVALAPGGDLILYVDPLHTPHAASYDGTLNLALPGPVAAVWSLPAPATP